MKSIYLIIGLILSLPALVLSQIIPEQPFANKIPTFVWNAGMETLYFQQYFKYLRMPRAADNIILANSNDTTEIIFILDNAVDYIRWYRCSWRPQGDTLVYIGDYGRDHRYDNMYFMDALNMTINSDSPIYNSQTDNIFVVDRMRKYLFKLNFIFDPENPSRDMIITDDSIRVDSLFKPFDIEYIKYDCNGLNWNKLFVLDQYRSCFFVFDREGGLLARLNFESPEDETFHDYSGFTYRLNHDGTINFYIVDWPMHKVFGYCYNPGNNNITKFGELLVENAQRTDLSDIVYYSPIGLWIFDRHVNKIMSLSEDLGQINGFIDIDSLGLAEVERVGYMSVLDGHIIIMGMMGNNSGIYSFSTGFHALRAGKAANAEIPIKFALDQNYPNPFNPNTLINYAIPKQSQVRLDVFNILGQKVITLVDKSEQPGFYSATWDGVNSEGKSTSSGIYFYKISAGDYTEIKKMVLIK
jgi:hypothetical protein